MRLIRRGRGCEQGIPCFDPARPDQWSSHYNLGNYYLNRGEPKKAIASYETALKLEPRAVLAMVNESMAYARMGENEKADESLQQGPEDCTRTTLRQTSTWAF